jgi:orotate phosphoribosyltransferase
VEADLIRLARPRRGHFDLGTGYHGDLWLDLDALFLRPALLRPHIRSLAGRLAGHKIDAVCGPAAGGAFLAQAVADLLGVAFLPAHRRPPPAPGAATGYRIPPSMRSRIGGWRVAITDDAINAGTAALASFHQVRDGGAVPVAIAALLELGPARAMVRDTMPVPFYAAAALPSQVWPASACPLCASGTRPADPLPTD